jgi:hypothetical protein
MSADAREIVRRLTALEANLGVDWDHFTKSFISVPCMYQHQHCHSLHLSYIVIEISCLTVHVCHFIVDTRPPDARLPPVGTVDDLPPRLSRHGHGAGSDGLATLDGKDNEESCTACHPCYNLSFFN